MRLGMTVKSSPSGPSCLSRRPCRSAVDHPARLPRFLDNELVPRGLLQGLGRLDLNAEPGEPDIGARAGCVQLDRADPQIAQDLRTESDILPLPAAFQLGRGRLLGNRGGRHARGTVAQINEDAAPQIGRATSELQSHVNLVCRLLLEKKNKNRFSLPATKKKKNRITKPHKST